MFLSGNTLEFTVVISMWRDGAANAPRRPTDPNSSTGQRMNVSPMFLESHVRFIELNLCVSSHGEEGHAELMALIVTPLAREVL